VIGFVGRRLGFRVLVLAGLSLASFCFFASLPETFPSAHPLLPAYWTWVKGLGSGTSLHPLTQPVRTVLNPHRTTMLEALGHTALLLALALVLVLVFSALSALWSARRPGSATDLVLRGGSYLAWGTPAFLLALLAQKLMNGFGGQHGLGPFAMAGWPGSCPAGLGINNGTLPSCASAGSGVHYLLNVLRYVTVPAVVLAIGFVGLHGRYLRSSLVETLDAPFVTTARAKGLTDRGVLLGHAMRASLATFLAGVLGEFGALFGAAMAVDWVFELNGLGTALVNEFPLDSAAPIDLYSLQLVLLITGVLVIVSSLFAEVALTTLDPRIRAEA
jgi:peptide/nickel transport system permease protein